MKRILKPIVLLSLIVIISAGCSVSYKFNGASIDYSKTKTITISNFPNNAPLNYSLMESQFNDALTGIFARQTRLTQVNNNGDLQLEGEIYDYSLTPLAIGSNAYASETKLTLIIKVTFINNSNPEESFTSRSFSANRTFSNTSTLNEVQETYVTEMIDEIVDAIFNATVANW